MEKSIILLSGGLDSLVSLGILHKKLDIELAITFDYGQKSANKEIAASKRICEYYNIKHQVIKLDWLKNITKTAIVSDAEIPKIKNGNDFNQSAKLVWVPNRNGLFLNIAASFADSFGYENIIIGANKEEAATFPDNTKEFIDRINEEFQYSTLQKPKVVAPLINYDKNDIVKVALEQKIPLELTMSCYEDVQGHCAECESCIRLKQALKSNNAQEYISILFK